MRTYTTCIHIIMLNLYMAVSVLTSHAFGPAKFISDAGGTEPAKFNIRTDPFAIWTDPLAKCSCIYIIYIYIYIYISADPLILQGVIRRVFNYLILNIDLWLLIWSSALISDCWSSSISISMSNLWPLGGESRGPKRVSISLAGGGVPQLLGKMHHFSE